VFGSAKALATISGICVAAGEILGGVLFGLLGHLTVKRVRYPIIILGFILSMIGYVLMFINIPAEASIRPTTAEAYITSNVGITLATSFLFGFSDACMMTQVSYFLFIVNIVILDDINPGRSLRRPVCFSLWYLQVCPIPRILHVLYCSPVSFR
jgi:hypothetical protein